MTAAETAILVGFVVLALVVVVVALDRIDWFAPYLDDYDVEPCCLVPHNGRCFQQGWWWQHERDGTRSRYWLLRLPSYRLVSSGDYGMGPQCWGRLELVYRNDRGFRHFWVPIPSEVERVRAESLARRV